MSSAVPPQYDDVQSVTPSDTNLLAAACQGFFCNGAGTIKFTTPKGSTVTLTVLAGMVYPFQATQIFATGTSATGIFACYTQKGV